MVPIYVYELDGKGIIKKQFHHYMLFVHPVIGDNRRVKLWKFVLKYFSGYVNTFYKPDTYFK